MSSQPENSGNAVKHFVGKFGKSFGVTRQSNESLDDFRYGYTIKKKL
tara:strand:- start:22620 stop:22760 length:141 start_codon:yes stop_codon:yes gene_type:complete